MTGCYFCMYLWNSRRVWTTVDVHVWTVNTRRLSTHVDSGRVSTINTRRLSTHVDSGRVSTINTRWVDCRRTYDTRRLSTHVDSGRVSTINTRRVDCRRTYDTRRLSTCDVVCWLLFLFLCMYIYRSFNKASLIYLLSCFHSSVPAVASYYLLT